MNKKELEQKLIEMEVQLKALGDLNILVQQGQSLPNIISDTQTKKVSIESFLTDLPTRSEELSRLTSEVRKMNDEVVARDKDVHELNAKTEELQKKVQELIEQTKIQLGVAANAKLASTFEQVKTDLSSEKEKMFRWLVKVVGFLVVATLAVVWWQIQEEETLYHFSFPLRIALLSPIIYFVVFINREYNRVRNLIEEYTFKAAIARSFEAYKEIVQSADLQNSGKTTDFILRSITDLYSSPMVNIKNNAHKDKENEPDILPGVGSVMDTINKQS